MSNKNKTVKTVSNKEVLLSKCKKIDELYYEVGDINIENSGDCYLIGGKWYKNDINEIVYNYTTKSYCRSNTPGLMLGIIKFEDEKPIFGYFLQPVNLVSVQLSNRSNYYLFDENIIKGNLFYRERISTGNYHHIHSLKANLFNEIKVPSIEYKQSLPYDSKGIIDQYLKSYNENYNPEIYENIKKYGRVLEDLSFGLEFETSKGFIPLRILNNIGLIPLRDGSITGIEYVTVPLKGEKGLQCVIDSTKLLKERTVFDNSCSLHLHLGNIPRTKEFILAFLKLTLAFQDNIYRFFPLYKKYNLKVKNKNYSKPYPVYELLSQLDNVITRENIDANFDIIYKYLANESFYDVGCNLNNVNFHPADPQGTQKWNIKSRYYIHNFIPLLFGNKTTVEFRIHTPTYDVNKIIPYILFSSLLVNYTIRNQKNILENKTFLSFKSIYDVLHEQLDSYNLGDNNLLYEYLRSYFINRVSQTELQSSLGNIIGDEFKIGIANHIKWDSPKIVVNTYKLPESLVNLMINDWEDDKVKINSDYKNGKLKRSDAIKFISELDEKISDIKNKNKW